jgi:hypothetical protein
VAKTPEGKVKDAVRKVLDTRKHMGYGIYYNFPVPAGYGTPMLDVVGCYFGRFFGIETKVPGSRPTPRQLLTISQMREAGGAVFVIDGEPGLKELEAWLDDVERSAGIGRASGSGHSG